MLKDTVDSKIRYGGGGQLECRIYRGVSDLIGVRPLEVCRGQPGKRKAAPGWGRPALLQGMTRRAGSGRNYTKEGTSRNFYCPGLR